MAVESRPWFGCALLPLQVHCEREPTAPIGSEKIAARLAAEALPSLHGSDLGPPHY